MNILLIITGGIAAYKSCELIRQFKRAGHDVTPVLTNGAKQFVTPMTIGCLAENQVYDDLWSLTDEVEIGHIKLVRQADHIVVAPATANFIAKIANGIADDLASTMVLAKDPAQPITLTPAMNVQMWQAEATQNNIQTLQSRGMHIIDPDHGAMACGEFGPGRLPDPELIYNIVIGKQPLKGKKVVITLGGTQEAIDPVRCITNHSSGKQGVAIAQALLRAGADVIIIHGAVTMPLPKGAKLIEAKTAQAMLDASLTVLPADIYIACAAVSDWTPVTPSSTKLKKISDQDNLSLTLTKTPDILKTIANHDNRPNLVIGFAAETNDIQKNARAKLQAKNCDWLCVNSVEQGKGFGADHNQISIYTASDINDLGQDTKVNLGKKLVDNIIHHFESQ